MDDPGDRALRFEVLGPLRAWRRDAGVDLGSVQQRVVLAVLLLHRDRPVDRQHMIDAVWGEAEPRCAVNLLHRHVSGLRRALEPDRADRTSPSHLVWADSGYRLAVPVGRLDLGVFERDLDLSRRARAAGDLAAAADVLRSALTQWRGPVCTGLSSPFLDAERDRMNEWHISLIEECLELDVAVGARADTIAKLRKMVAEYPLREKLHGLLMLALYRAGLRVEALEAFQDVRRLLREELGVDPAASLQRLHEQILNGDPDLGGPVRETRASAVTDRVTRHLPVPAQLPHATPGFTGREAEITQLNEFLPREGMDVAGPVIVVIAGTAGVGKSALALQWAHQIRDRFPDGQLYVNLRGFDPVGPVMAPAEAIRLFLDSFGMPPGRIPVDLDAQAALYRSLLAGRRLLIMCDNARDVDQIRPLLPGEPSCLVVVTSRNQLLSLVAADGGHPLAVDLLSKEQARALLVRRLSAQRVAAEPAAADEIIDSCAGLPLALAMVCARVAANPRLLLEDLAEELRETRGGLYMLGGGDDRTDLRAVFSWSYQALSPAAARLFRLLGLHAGPEIGWCAAASLAGLTPAQSRALLAELTSAHLLIELHRGRFTFHDLLRAYASELADAHDPPAQRRAAVRRALDHYLRTAYRANDLVRPSRDDTITLTPSEPLVTPENPADHRRALSWFTTEYPVLLAALRQAASEGFHVHTWQLAWALTSFFDRQGHWHDAAQAQEAAVRAADRLRDPDAQAKSHGCLAYAYIGLGRYADARSHLTRALELYGRIGDGPGQAHVHRIVCWALDRQASYREALQHAYTAAELFQDSGHRTGQARALNAIGWFHIQLGEYEKGLMRCQQALDMQTEINDQFGQADTLDSIASAYRYLGRCQLAITHYKRAMDIYHEFGDRYGEADVLVCLGDTQVADGDQGSAGISWNKALAILEELDHPDSMRVREKLIKLRHDGS